MPELFGFCGEVALPSSLLSRIVSMIDADLLYDPTSSADARLRTVEAILQEGSKNYPREMMRNFSVLYCSRSTEGRTPAAFHVARTDWKGTSSWESQWLELPDSSGLVAALGSGAVMAEELNKRWNRSEVGGTSRAVFSGFCDHLRSANDPNTGGPPQLVGAYRKGPAQTFGIVSEARLTYLGMPIPDPDRAPNVDWRNVLFERCDPKTGRRLEGAQPQPRPSSLA
jgi:hypothetical protein